ncbi:6388_t:CDS:2, partial [Dentiscutata erythropus]
LLFTYHNIVEELKGTSETEDSHSITSSNIADEIFDSKDIRNGEMKICLKNKGKKSATYNSKKRCDGTGRFTHNSLKSSDSNIVFEK